MVLPTAGAFPTLPFMSTHGKPAPRIHAGVITLVAWLAVPGLAGAAELETRIVSGPPRVTFTRLAEFVFESDEPQATFECSLNSERFFPCESPLRLYARIQLGERYTLQVRARFGERVDPSPASHTWRTLLGKPLQPIIIEPEPGALVKMGTLHVAGLAAPGGKLTVLLDGKPVATADADIEGEWGVRFPVDVGPHTLLAELEDGAGELIAPTEPVEFTVQPLEVGGCSSAGGAPALFLIGLAALAIMNSRRRCTRESSMSSRGCDCCR